jgi:hypothetical protein
MRLFGTIGLIVRLIVMSEVQRTPTTRGRSTELDADEGRNGRRPGSNHLRRSESGPLHLAPSSGFSAHLSRAVQRRQLGGE